MFGLLEVLVVGISALIGYWFNRNREGKYIVAGVLAGIAGGFITTVLLSQFSVNIHNYVNALFAIIGAVIFSFLQVKIMK